jgi:hypothetical protein
MPPYKRGDSQKKASRSRSQEPCHKQQIDYSDINGLHGSNALCRRQSGKDVHHEGREGKEDSGYQPTRLQKASMRKASSQPLP